MLADLQKARDAAYIRATIILSRGSVSLQNGNYATEEEIDKLRAKVASYEFKSFRKAASR